MENKRIYIVDNDTITVFGIRKLLSKIVDKETIASFENGQLAYDSIISRIHGGKEIPDIIFLDINMPIMDGWQFLEAFSELNIKKIMRINMITSSIDPADYERWSYFQKKMPHYLDFMNKPVLKITAEDISLISKAS